MMKFSVGYQQDARQRWADAILRRRENVAEVYFPWGGLPNGRAPTAQTMIGDPGAQARALEELAAFAEAGIARNLLFNGMCYGAKSLSRELFDKIGEIVDFLGERIGVQSVTTTSPVIAEYLKGRYPQLEIRASVNMDIADLKGFQYLSDVFDAFYIGRSLNRRFDEIARIRSWADANGKRLSILLNSGCLAACPAHAFHDNLVSHEAEIAREDNAVRFHALCRKRLASPEGRISLISDTSFIRPEDVKLYEPYFDVAKLATRSNPNPARVLEAYVRGAHFGNLCDLLEPDYAALFYPDIIDNRAFPEEYASVVGSCSRRCETCGYCEDVLKRVLVRPEF